MHDNFGKRLRNLRKKAGLTQEQLAIAINVSLKTVQRWELGQREPRFEDIKALAIALGVSEADLLHDNHEHSSNWILSITVRQELKEEVIDLSKPIPEISTIITANTGAYIALGGSYDLWLDNEGFSSIVKQLKKMRDGVIQQGKSNGAIPDDSKKRR